MREMGVNQDHSRGVDPMGSFELLMLRGSPGAVYSCRVYALPAIIEDVLRKPRKGICDGNIGGTLSFT